MEPAAMEEESALPARPKSGMNFKEKLMNIGGFGLNKEELEKDRLKIEDDDFEVSEGSRGPCIRFSEKVKDSLYRPWKNAIIIKLMGKAHAFNFLLTRLKQKWSMLKGPMSLIDLENNFYIVRFALDEDMRYVFSGGPWVIAGQSLVMQRWKPGFNPNEATITRMAVWVRITGLHIEWFNAEAIKRIGDLIGITYRIDTHTIAQARGKYARICVEIDLTKPLIANIQVENNWYGLEYEGLHLVCFGCGIYGHNKQQCPAEIRTHADTNNKPMGDKSENDKSPNTMEITPPDLPVPEGPPGNSDANSGRFGPWSLAKPFRKNKKALQSIEGKGDVGKAKSGSRFDLLQSNDEINDDSQDTILQPHPTDPQQCQIAPTSVGTGKLGETSMKNHEIQQSKSTQRIVLGEISNKGKGQQANSVSGPLKNNLAAPAGMYFKKPIAKPRAPKKTHLSNGYQVRSLDIQEENSGGLSNIVSKYLSGTEGSSVFIPATISGHDPPNIDQSTASKLDLHMVTSNATEISHLPHTVTIETGMLRKVMVDVKSGVVGSASALVEALSSTL
ncbi:hypothetical protein CerSpe_176560 [Prunus speciosa]